MPSRSAGRMQRIGFALVVRPLLRFWVGVRVSGTENLPDEPPYIIISNYASHLDAAIVLTAIPKNRLHEIRPVAEAEYFTRNRFLSWVTSTFFNILPISRSANREENDPIQVMKTAIDDGYALLIFPEGTRNTDDEQLQPFRPGVARLVEHHPNILFLPVWVHGARRSLPEGTYFPVPLFCELRIGEARTVSGTEREILQTLENAVLDLRGSE